MTLVRMALTVIGVLATLVGLFWLLQDSGIVPINRALPPMGMVRDAAAVVCGFVLIIISKAMATDT